MWTIYCQEVKFGNRSHLCKYNIDAIGMNELTERQEIPKPKVYYVACTK